MALFVVSMVCGYILSGIAMVVRERTASVIQRSSYGNHPTFRMTVLVILAWPVLAYIDSTSGARGRLGRTIWYTLISSIIQTVVIGVCVWGVLSLFKIIFF